MKNGLSKSWYDNARSRMRELKINVTEVGDLWGISQGAASMKLNGTRGATIEEIMILAERLGMSLQELCIGDSRFAGNEFEEELFDRFRSMDKQQQSMILKMMRSLEDG